MQRLLRLVQVKRLGKIKHPVGGKRKQNKLSKNPKRKKMLCLSSISTIMPVSIQEFCLYSSSYTQ